MQNNTFVFVCICVRQRESNNNVFIKVCTRDQTCIRKYVCFFLVQAYPCLINVSRALHILEVRMYLTDGRQLPELGTAVFEKFQPTTSWLKCMQVTRFNKFCGLAMVIVLAKSISCRNWIGCQTSMQQIRDFFNFGFKLQEHSSDAMCRANHFELMDQTSGAQSNRSYCTI